jgi:hypothetical protein
VLYQLSYAHHALCEGYFTRSAVQRSN